MTICGSGHTRISMARKGLVARGTVSARHKAFKALPSSKSVIQSEYLSAHCSRQAGQKYNLKQQYQDIIPRTTPLPTNTQQTISCLACTTVNIFYFSPGKHPCHIQAGSVVIYIYISRQFVIVETVLFHIYVFF